MKKCWAEFIGTFALVFAGTGAIIVNSVSGGAITHVGIALTFGLVVMVMIYAVGEISGAQFNPAVTVGFWAAGRMKEAEALRYVASQVAGALLASVVLRVLFPTHPTLGATIPAGPDSQSFLLEIVLTFFLMFVILGVTSGSKETGVMAGIASGGTVGLDALFGGPISGASMNPARSLAPALISGHMSHLWIYIAAPIIGAHIAVACHRRVRRQDDSSL